MIRLQAALAEREGRYAQILMVGRTELQDALPITLGQVFGSWAGMFERDRWRLHKIKERIRTVPLGGTAVGTGFPAPAMVVFAAEEALRRITGLPWPGARTCRTRWPTRTSGRSSPTGYARWRRTS